ncbi:MAG: hypothetical protein ONB44_03330 [candidate division KSB1 bacterium]|nr:hypothetical protein [candidate division KSB1 bacterium]MDZ7301160.1 hypothetical protein [candidate division KSB1 bacterium]MDZ7310616.1 hypothetical protein [candidate division KSB1 bacterium]
MPDDLQQECLNDKEAKTASLNPYLHIIPAKRVGDNIKFIVNFSVVPKTSEGVKFSRWDDGVAQCNEISAGALVLFCGSIQGQRFFEKHAQEPTHKVSP